MKHLAPRPQTRSFDFNILEIVGSKWKSRYVCQASIGRETSSPPPIIGLSECSVLPAAPDLKFTCRSIFQWLWIYESMAMLGVWSLVFFGIMAAAKLGGNSSCTRSNSQADKGRLYEQKPLHDVFCVAGMMLHIDISVWVLQKPEELCNVEWGVPKTISFRKKVPRIISK